MGAPASTASDDFVADSVHVSTKNLVDTSILKPSAAIKVPRLDAYLTYPSEEPPSLGFVGASAREYAPGKRSSRVLDSACAPGYRSAASSAVRWKDVKRHAPVRSSPIQ